MFIVTDSMDFKKGTATNFYLPKWSSSMLKMVIKPLQASALNVFKPSSQLSSS